MSWDPEQWKLTQEQTQAREHLRWAEGEMSKAAQQVRRALVEIHEKKSWRFDYDSFQDYCTKRLGMTEQRAYQILKGESVRAILLGACQGDEVKVVESLNGGQLEALDGMEPQAAIRLLKNSEGKLSGKKIKAARSSQAPENKDQKRLTHLITLLKEELTRGPITLENHLSVAQRLAPKIYTTRTKVVDSTVNTVYSSPT